MTKHWIKLWVEMLSDPKVARLPDSVYRKFIETLLLAGYRNDGGTLPSIADMAWILHTDDTCIITALNDLKACGLVHQNGNGDWVVTNFDKRQETPAAERMRRMRERKRTNDEQHRNSYGNCYGADSASASASLIKDSLINQNGDIGTLFRLYEQEIGTITKSIANKLTDAWNDYPHEWFELAFSEAARNNARNWAYVEAILKRWKVDGYQSKKGKRAKDDHYDPAANASEVYN